jgi:hypothetical protein
MVKNSGKTPCSNCAAATNPAEISLSGAFATESYDSPQSKTPLQLGHWQLHQLPEYGLDLRIAFGRIGHVH